MTQSDADWIIQNYFGPKSFPQPELNEFLQHLKGNTERLRDFILSQLDEWMMMACFVQNQVTAIYNFDMDSQYLIERLKLHFAEDIAKLPAPAAA
jgi:hypothetical protein